MTNYTLSELIEKCTKNVKYFMLTNECGKWEAWGSNKLGCVRMGESGAEYECCGDTPEDAVYKLYLKTIN